MYEIVVIKKNRNGQDIIINEIDDESCLTVTKNKVLRVSLIK